MSGRLAQENSEQQQQQQQAHTRLLVPQIATESAAPSRASLGDDHADMRLAQVEANADNSQDTNASWTNNSGSNRSTSSSQARRERKLSVVLPAAAANHNLLVTPTFTTSDPSKALTPTHLFSSLLHFSGQEVGLFTGLPSCTPTSADALAASASLMGANPFFWNVSAPAKPEAPEQPERASASPAARHSAANKHLQVLDQHLQVWSPLVLLSPENEFYLRFGLAPGQHPLAGLAEQAPPATNPPAPSEAAGASQQGAAAKYTAEPTAQDLTHPNSSLARPANPASLAPSQQPAPADARTSLPPTPVNQSSNTNGAATSGNSLSGLNSAALHQSPAEQAVSATFFPPQAPNPLGDAQQASIYHQLQPNQPHGRLGPPAAHHRLPDTSSQSPQRQLLVHNPIPPDNLADSQRRLAAHQQIAGTQMIQRPHLQTANLSVHYEPNSAQPQPSPYDTHLRQFYLAQQHQHHQQQQQQQQQHLQHLYQQQQRQHQQQLQLQQREQQQREQQQHQHPRSIQLDLQLPQLQQQRLQHLHLQHQSTVEVNYSQPGALPASLQPTNGIQGLQARLKPQAESQPQIRPVQVQDGLPSILEISDSSSASSASSSSPPTTTTPKDSSGSSNSSISPSGSPHPIRTTASQAFPQSPAEWRARDSGKADIPAATPGALTHLQTSRSAGDSRTPNKSSTANSQPVGADGEPVKKSKGGRKKKAVTHEELLARKNRSKERNRVAAKRCRQKRKQFLDELRGRIDALSDSNKKLQRDNTTLKVELETLRKHHQHCELSKLTNEAQVIER